jgi:hypothetical protein
MELILHTLLTLILGQIHAPAALPPGENRYTLGRRLADLLSIC